MTTTSITFNKSQALSEALWGVLTAVATIIIGIIFWYFGAGFTIIALKFLASAFSVPQAGIGWYFIPALFSAIELGAWKLKDMMSANQKMLAHGMTGVDMASTILGVCIASLVGSTSYVAALSAHLTISSQAMIAVYVVGFLLCCLVGWLVTIYPERLILGGFIQIYESAKVIKFCIKGGTI